MMSSTTNPSSFKQVRVLGAARRDLVEVVGQRRLQRVEHSGAVTAHGAEVADVKDDRVASTGQVFGDGTRRVLQGHLPAAEGHDLGARARRGGRRGTAVDRSIVAIKQPARRHGVEIVVAQQTVEVTLVDDEQRQSRDRARGNVGPSDSSSSRVVGRAPSAR